MKKYLFAVLPVMMLAACQSPSSAQAEQGVESKMDTCGSSTRQNLVGQPAADIDKSTLPAGARILHPNTATTMDYRLERLNIRVNAEGIVEKVYCG